MTRNRWQHLVRSSFDRKSARGSSNLRSGKRNPKNRFRPSFECLDDRVVPAVITVNSSLDDSAVDSSVSLREAILSINQGSDFNSDVTHTGTFGTNDTIVFASGLAGDTITLSSALPDLSKSISIQGLGADKLAISGNNAVRVFRVDSGVTASLDGLTITKGFVSASLQSPGIENDSGTLTITNCTIVGNSGGVVATFCGGGIGNYGGTVTAINCTISNNNALDFSGGGGIYNDGTFTAINCTISGNGFYTSYSTGGGIFIHAGSFTASGCTISGNRGDEGGGGIGIGHFREAQATVTLTDCTIAGNTAWSGGGIANGGLTGAGTVTATNCTIEGNTAQVRGGGVFQANNGGFTLINCTISANSTTESNHGSDVGGGGICNQIGTIYKGTVTLANTIVAGNTAATGGQDVDGAINSSGFNLVGKTDGSTGWVVGSDLTGTIASPLDPMLAPLGNYGGRTQTMALLPGSPAINAGTSTGAPSSDERGQARVGPPDIGAYEWAVSLYATGAGLHGGPEVKVFNDDGSLRFDFFAYDPSFTGGVRVATADVNGDGIEDIIVAPGPGMTGDIRVFSGLDSHLLREIPNVFDGFTGGVFVAGGDVNGDGLADIIVGADAGGGPRVRVLDGANPNNVLADYFAYNSNFTGGVRLACADVNGDGKADVITTPGPGGGPELKVFSSNTQTLVFDYWAFDPTYSGGVMVAAGDLDGDGKAEMIASETQEAGGAVHVFSGIDSHYLGTISPFTAGSGPVSVGVEDRDGDGWLDIETGIAGGAPTSVRVFKGTTLAQIGTSQQPYDPSFLGGVFVG